MRKKYIVSLWMAGTLLALSTAAVAAKDYQTAGLSLSTASSSSSSSTAGQGQGPGQEEKKKEIVEEDDLVFGIEKKYSVKLKDIPLRNNRKYSFSTKLLASLMEQKKLSATVLVTEGLEHLESVPEIRRRGEEAVMAVRFQDTYGTETAVCKLKARFTALEPIYSDYYLTVTQNGQTYYLNRSYQKTSSKGVFTLTELDGALKKAKEKGFTQVKAVGKTQILRKGDTMTGVTLKLTASYPELENYGGDITLTTYGVEDRYVLAKGEQLYAYADTDNRVSLYFGETGDFATLTFRPLSTQKDLNLYYSLTPIVELLQKYPNVDMDFISFKGEQSGQNVLGTPGTLTFPALGGKNTAVYTYDQNKKELKPVKSTFSSIDDTVVVSDVKRLTTYVVMEKAL